MLEYISFLLASAGAATLIKVFVSKTEFIQDTWLNNKPFSCPLCMGFWSGCVLSGIMYGSGYGWFWVVYRGLQAAAFSWFFYWKVTGDK